LSTYYNINKDQTVWDDEFLIGGYYEKIGNLSGVKFDKYLLLPLYYIEDATFEFDGREEGLVVDSGSAVVFPWQYGIQPYANDILKFEQAPLVNTPAEDTNPLYYVGGVQKMARKDKTFFKLKVSVDQSHTLTNVDPQVVNTYVFFDYTKKIYSIPQSQTLSRMLVKNSVLRETLKGRFDFNSGFYFL